MSSDPNKKSGRTFQCRDVLWETFEQMARELECSVDYLINEAMKQYARQRSYGTRPQFPSTPGQASPASERGGYPPPPPPPRAGGLPPPPARPSRATPGALPPPPARAQTGQGMHGLPAPPPRGPSGQMPAVPRSVPPPARSAPPPIPRGGVPGMPNMPGPGTGQMGQMASNGYPPQVNAHAGPQLCVMYQGEKIPVNKDRFVIGRGKQSSDLTLKDPNVSRQHAMIEFQNGIYFMVDMGSTNGVEYNGQRIARKQIAEGDLFKICDHDLRFTYR